MVYFGISTTRSLSATSAWQDSRDYLLNGQPAEFRTGQPATALRTAIAREELARLPDSLIRSGMGYRLSDNPNTHRSRVRRMREAQR